jgi:putative tail protein
VGTGSKKVTVGYRYYFDIHMGLGLPIDELVAIRASKKEAWRGSITANGQITINKPKLFGGDKGEGGLQGTLDVLFGEEDQGVLARLAAMLGGIVPAFRGMSTAFYSGLITSMNPYPKPWDILRRGGNRLWGGEAAWYPEKQFIWLASGQVKAMNPAHILFLIYTSRLFRGLPRARMDDTAWRAAADALYAEQLGLCLEWKRSDSFKVFRDAVLAHISAEVYVDRRSGLLSIRLLRDDYVVDDLPLFDEDSGLLEITEEEAPSDDAAPSELIVKYVDAITGDRKAVRAVNSAVAARAGGRSSQTVDYPGAPTGEIAARLAQRDLRIKTSGLKRYKVVLDRRGRTLTPGAAFRLRSLARGIDQVVVRAGRIEDGTLRDGRITVTALQDVFGLPATSFVAVPPVGWLPPDRTPVAVTSRRLLEVSYRELAGILDPSNLSLVSTTAAYLAVVAEAPSAMSLSYDLTDRVGSSGEFTARDVGDWCPSGLLSGAMAIAQGPTAATVVSSSRLEDVQVGQAALVDGEILRVDAIDYTSGAVTFARGCIDSVPAGHAAGARVWFYDGFASVDAAAYSSGVTLQARLLTNTSEGQLDPSSASIDSLTLQGRQGRPYPPGLLKLNGVAFPASITEDDGVVAVSWAHRDRLLEADQVIDTAVGNIGPEPGTTYNLRIYNADSSVLLQNLTGLTGTSAAIVMPSGSYSARVELESVRDGLLSWQKHSFTFAFFLAAGRRITEAGDLRITEAGDARALE